jgi:pyruvate carboxylase
MLLRGSNGVGYKAYPDNLVSAFTVKAAEEGIDVFRIFDALNWVKSMAPAIKVVRNQTHAIAEACLCYTGDLSSPEETKYTLDYYLDLARQLEDAGAHMLAIKDMAGLLKPKAAEILIPALRKAVDLPIHLHTHDTSSIQSATYLSAVNAGVDVIDCALAGMSGLTSQPSFNSVVAMLQDTKRERKIDLDSLNRHSQYWEAVRTSYLPFETELRSGTAEIYDTEIPGGQYSNLRPQARGLGLEHRFEEVKANYAKADEMLGRLVKVTPSSKVVGDLALFMTSNDLTEEQMLDPKNTLSWPDSIRQLMRGDLGQAMGGFPKKLQKAVLQGEKPYKGRPNSKLKKIDFAEEAKAFAEAFPDAPPIVGEPSKSTQLLSSLLYPQVYKDYVSFHETYSVVAPIPTPAFFYGLAPNEEIEVELEKGKTINVKYLSRTVPSASGEVLVLFKLNGQTRTEAALDLHANVTVVRNRVAQGEGQIGAPLQGAVSRVMVKAGDKVHAGDPLFVLEAMKMESTVTAPMAGKVTEVVLGPKSLVAVGDLVVVIG